MATVVRCGDVQDERMQKNHITGLSNILEHLERNAVMLLDTLHEPRDALVRVPLGVQVANIRMSTQQHAIIRATRAGRRRIVVEPLVHQAM